MRVVNNKRVILSTCVFFFAVILLYISRPHLTSITQINRNAISQTPTGMDATLEKEALDQVAESADMTYPPFDYTYDKIDIITTTKRRSKDPCSDVMLPNGGTKARDGDGQRVLITGGAGFIGSNLVDRLLQLGYKVRILDNLYTGFLRNVPLNHSSVEFLLEDILNHTALDNAMKDVDYVFHLAAMSKVVPSLKDPDMARFCTEANALGSWNVLNAVRNQGNIKKVIYAASSTYYGNRPPPHSEDLPADFLTPYAASKYEGEIQMQMFDRLFGVPTLSTRFFMVYGPRQPSTGAYAIVTGVFAKQAADGRPLTIEGDGTHYRDFIHVRDIVEGMIISQQIVDLRGQVVNLGAGTSFSVNDVANLISSNQIHVDPRPNDLEGTLADTCKMKRLLNFRASADFKREMGYMARETMAGNVFMQAWLTPHLALSAPHLLAPGSPVFRWPADNSDLDALLLAMQHVENTTNNGEGSESERVTVIIFSSTAEHAEERGDVLLNTVFSLVRFGEVRQYLVAAVDDDALNTCLALNLPCHDARKATVPSLLKHLTKRGKDIHLARYGNSYISSVQKWIDQLTAKHGNADIFGAAPQGDLFIFANDHSRQALRNWPETHTPRLSQPKAVEMLHDVQKWPPLELDVKKFEVDRWCNNMRVGGGASPDLPLPHSTSFSYMAASEPTASVSSRGAASSASESTRPDSDDPTLILIDEHEPQTLAEAERMAEKLPDEDQILERQTQKRSLDDGDDEEGDGDDNGSKSSMQADNSLEASCRRAFYRAIGCAQAAPLLPAPQLVRHLRAANAWHLTECKDRKHCDRQQVVPKRWIGRQPDLAPTGGLC